jgi:hypothetical protein
MSAHYIEVSAAVRYWEDSSVNGIVDDDGTLMPFRYGDLWKPLIRIEDGAVFGWPEGMTASIRYKVCDAGDYWLTNEENERIAKWNGHYVPNKFLCHGDDGWGDYIIFNVGADGRVIGWKRPVIDADEWLASGEVGK